jgi:hypothetical protein
MKNYLKIAAVLLATSIASMAFAEDYKCPTLTASDVQATIDGGYGMEDKQYGSEFYYVWASEKNIDNKTYRIVIGRVLGKDAFEARDRAKKILLTDEESFNGLYISKDKFCLYKGEDASKFISDYPAGADNIVVLVAVDASDRREPIDPQNLFIKR